MRFWKNRDNSLSFMNLWRVHGATGRHCPDLCPGPMAAHLPAQMKTCAVPGMQGPIELCHTSCSGLGLRCRGLSSIPPRPLSWKSHPRGRDHRNRRLCAQDLCPESEAPHRVPFDQRRHNTILYNCLRHEEGGLQPGPPTVSGGGIAGGRAGNQVRRGDGFEAGPPTQSSRESRWRGIPHRNRAGVPAMTRRDHPQQALGVRGVRGIVRVTAGSRPR